jgi:predicted dehydrogenase
VNSAYPLRSLHIGVGGRGRGHLEAAITSGYWRPVALVDVVPDHLAAARELTRLPAAACFARLDDALGAIECNAVVVASPVMHHAPQILAALRANRHVLTEKCFTVDLTDAEQCVAEAERRGRKLMVVQNWRRTPPARTLRRLVAEERYGPLGLFLLSYFKARGAPYHDSPHMHLWQMAVHELDTILAVVQRPLRRVWGLSSNPAWCDWPSPSTAQVIADFAGGISGSYLGTSNARADAFAFRIECADAAIVADDPLDCGVLRVFWGPRDRREESLALDAPDIRGLERHPLARALAAGVSAERRAWSQFFDAQIYRDFAEYIAEEVEPETSGRRNLETMRFVDAVQRSSEEGRPIACS